MRDGRSVGIEDALTNAMPVMTGSINTGLRVEGLEYFGVYRRTRLFEEATK